MKRKLVSVFVALLIVSMSAFIVGCGTSESVKKHKVTFYDGATVIKTVDVEEGKTVESYTPTKDGGYVFVDWYSTPSYNHKYDFTKAITEDVSVFAGFTLFKNDTRSFYVVGSGSSELLIGQNWGKNINDSHKLTKADGKNEYAITMDLLEGDEFQFAINSSWENKRGYGYLVTDKLADGTVIFRGDGGGLGEVTAKGRNIKVAKSGNYTLTLKTYPNEDTYNTKDSAYTEATKEIFNVGTFDTIEFVRNGDPLVATVVVTNYYIKGSCISGWADMYNADTTMTKVGDTYTLTAYMRADDQFMFASYNSSADGITDGSQYIKSNALDEASRSVLDGYTEAGGNMKTKQDGLYTFVYDKTENKLTVTVDATAAMPEYDYYLDGKTESGLNWKAADLTAHKFVKSGEVYVYNNVELAVGDEIIVRYYEKGTETPDYNNAKGIYSTPNLLPKLAETDAFAAASATNPNIKVKVAGKYNISVDPYTKIVKIAAAAAQASAYLKGSAIESWGNKPESGKMALVEGKFELILTVNAGDQLMIQYFAPGEESEWGAAFNAKNVVDGPVNANFDLTGNNIVVVEGGLYRFVFDPSNETIAIYTQLS